MTGMLSGDKSPYNSIISAESNGCYLVDRNRKRYLDCSGHASVSGLGHADADIRDRLYQRSNTTNFLQSGLFTSKPTDALSEELILHAPNGLEHIHFVTGGSEAVDAAKALSECYFLEIGEPTRNRIIVQRQSRYSQDSGRLETAGIEHHRNHTLAPKVKMEHIAQCYEYRDRLHNESQYDYGQWAANDLEHEIQAIGEKNVMGFICEPVVGTTAGAIPAVPGYLSRVREICDQYGILLIFDEVSCGMGRTGYLFTCNEDRVSPDMIAFALAPGVGLQPIGGLVYTSHIHNFCTNTDVLQRGHACRDNPMAATAALAVIKKIYSDNLMSRVRVQGRKLDTALRNGFADSKNIGDIRGRGLFIGIELVENLETKSPFDPSRAVHLQIKAQALNAGLICRSIGGAIDGINGDHLLLAPPFVIDDEQIHEVVSTLKTVIHGALD